MAYTYDQIIKAYTTLHVGKAPDTATAESLRLTATMNASGQLSDSQVVNVLINGADSTTAVAVLTYQFFTGKSPTAAGLTYLVNSPINTTDLQDPYYNKFNLENRYINFAANLGLYGQGAADFASKYGAVDFNAYVASVYQTIIGRSYAESAGVNVDAAISYLISTKDAVLQTLRDAGVVTVETTATQVDLAVKAAMAGLIMAASIKSDIGLYAAAADNFMVALTQGTAVYNTDITVTYRPSFDTAAHGTGHAVDRAPTALPNPVTDTPVTPVVPSPTYTFSLTLGSGVDYIRGTASGENFTATDATFSADDYLDGGAGNDRLTVTAAVAGTYAAPSLGHISNVERITLTNSGGGISVDATGATGVNRLDVTGNGGPVNVTSMGSITSTNIYANTQGANAIVANSTGGSGTLYIQTTGSTTGTITVNIGAGSNGGSDIYHYTTGTGTGGAIIVNGGRTMSVNQYTTNATGTTATNGDVTFNGSTDSQEFYVTNEMEATAGLGVKGVVGGNMVINDYNTVHTTGVGTINYGRLQGFHNATIHSNALTELWLTGGSGDVKIDNAYHPGGSATTLTLQLQDLNVGHLYDTGKYTTLNIQLQSLTNVIGNLDFSAVTAVHFSGSGSATLTGAALASMTSLHTIDFYGAGLTASFGATSALTTFDASQANQNIVVDFSAMTSAVTFTDHTGVDDVTVNSLANTLNFDNGGIGDKITITSAGSAATGGFNTIQGTALPMFGFTAHGNESFNQVMVADAGSLRATADAAILGMASGATDGQIAWFQYGGNTYLVESQTAAHATFQDGVDFIVKLAGLVDLSAGHATLTGHYVHF